MKPDAFNYKEYLRVVKENKDLKEKLAYYKILSFLKSVKMNSEENPAKLVHTTKMPTQYINTMKCK